MVHANPGAGAGASYVEVAAVHCAHHGPAGPPLRRPARPCTTPCSTSTAFDGSSRARTPLAQVTSGPAGCRAVPACRHRTVETQRPHSCDAGREGVVPPMHVFLPDPSLTL